MIDTKALRSRILDLAIQGKLTQQLESDGTAEEFYQQIQAEKQKMIKEGKIKKEKPLPPIKSEEIPFDIPSNWMWVRWGDLSESIQYGYNAPAKASGRIKMVRITDIQNNRVEWENVPFCDIEEENIATYLLKTNDILFARTGGTVGKSFIVTNITEEAIYAGYLIRTRYSSNLDGRYLKFFMDSRLYWKQLQTGTTATAQPNCNGKTLSKMIVPLPPLAEQKRIVERVEEIFRLLDTIDKAQEKYSADSQILKAKLITAGIQGKLTKQLESDGTAHELYQQIQEEKQKLIKEGKIKKEKPLPPIKPEEIPFETPKNWMWCHLGECIRLQSGQDFKPSEYNADNIGTPYLTGASNIDTSGDLIINRWTEKPTCIAEKNDVLIVCKGSGYGKINICTIDYAHIARQFMAVKYSDLIDTKFMKLFLISKLTVIKDNGQGLIPGIDRPSVLNLPFPLPPLAEQKRIAEMLERVLGALA